MSNSISKEPLVKVGILSSETISFELLGAYRCDDAEWSGPQTVTVADGKVMWQGAAYDSLYFTAANDESTFCLHDVVIGINFHWERKEDQRFAGDLSIIVEDGRLTAVNVLPVESYLASVISSEMSANASLELLKAHAVISRSWLLAQIIKHERISSSGNLYDASTVTDEEIVRWYDREDHVNFHVCADDHCQRYQGITRQTTAAVAQAVEETRGEVLTYEDELCDARFSKCCGGVFEEFEYCWEPRHYDYLEARRDAANEYRFPDLRVEEKAVEWIERRPDAFCNTDDKEILSQVLNNYDQETHDFFRWEVTYSRDELAAIVRERSGIDFGDIIDLKPMTRGTSGRLSRLMIVGTRRTMIIGKELEIRRTLSTSHLRSSAFTVERKLIDPDTGVPGQITLRGAGWGHGVGLCQIGAAVMGARGYDYRRILAHYFANAEITVYY